MSFQKTTFKDLICGENYMFSTPIFFWKEEEEKDKSRHAKRSAGLSYSNYDIDSTMAAASDEVIHHEGPRQIMLPVGEPLERVSRVALKLSSSLVALRLSSSLVALRLSSSLVALRLSSSLVALRLSSSMVISPCVSAAASGSNSSSSSGGFFASSAGGFLEM